MPEAMARLVGALILGQAFAASPACAQPAAMPGIADVVSVATVEFNDGGLLDRAMLVRDEDSVDLYLFKGMLNPDGSDGKLELAQIKKNIAWSGALWGTLPSLSVNGRGSLLVHSENSAIGRDKWQQTLTIAMRGGALAVVGVSYSSYDGLDPKAGGSCDLNLVTGKGLRNGKPVSFPAGAVKVADWSDDSLPKDCRF